MIWYKKIFLITHKINMEIDLPNDIWIKIASLFKHVDVDIKNALILRSINKLLKTNINTYFYDFYKIVLIPYYDSMRVKISPSLYLRYSIQYIYLHNISEQISFEMEHCTIRNRPRNTCCLTLRQCNGTNKNGNQCRRQCISTYCWQHHPMNADYI